MAEKFINAIPLVSENEVNDNIKIPVSTGGTKAAAVSVGQIKKHVKADILSQTVTTDASKAPSSLAVHGKFEKQQQSINAVGARVDELEKGGGGANITVDKAVISGSGNAVSGGAVYNELQKKVSSANLATINGHRLDEGEHITIEGGTGGGSNVYVQNAILTKGNLIKEVEFGKYVLDNGNINTNATTAYAKFVSVAGMASIKISTSFPSMTKGCFYRLKDTSSKLESINISGGAVYDKEVVVPKGANFAQINFSREDIINGVALIQEVGSTNIEGVLPRVKSFAPLSVSRIIENQYMNKDGGMTEFTGLHTYIYNVENIEDVFLDGGSDLQPKVSYVQIKDKSGKVLWKFDHYSNINKFKKFHLFLPEGAAELWVLYTIDVLSVKEQSEVNKEFSEQLESLTKGAEDLRQQDVNTNNEIAGIKTRLTKVEGGGGSSSGGVNPLNHWAGKKIVWIGASVPQGQTTLEDAEADGGSGGVLKRPYPVQVGEILQCKLVNKSQGGLSLLSMRLPEGKWVNAHKWGCSLSLTQAEVKAAGAKFTWSYEDVILANKDADLFVFDTEPNNSPIKDVLPDADKDILAQFDFANWKWRDGSDFKEHRDNYQGAMLFILNELYKVNSFARIAFVREFIPYSPEAWGKEFQTANQAKRLAEELHVPYIELQKKLQYNAANRYSYIIGPRLYNETHLYSKTHAIIAKILANELVRIA